MAASKNGIALNAPDFYVNQISILKEGKFNIGRVSVQDSMTWHSSLFRDSV